MKITEEQVKESFELGRCIQAFGFEYICKDEIGSEISFQKQINEDDYHSLVWDRESNQIAICSYNLKKKIIGNEYQFENVERLYKGRVANKKMFSTI